MYITDMSAFYVLTGQVTYRMSQPITAWLSIGSTYSYLTALRINAIKQEKGLNLLVKPISIRAIMKSMDNIPFPPSKKTKVDNDAIDLYRQFNGTDPTEIVSKTVWLPDENSPLVALGEGDCPFIGYTSAKTNKKGEKDDYIHHFGEEGGQPPKLYVTCPPPGYERIMMIIGGDWKIEERADGKLWLVD